MDRDELQALIPAYTLGALDEDERAAFEAWLTSDVEAQLLVAEYQAIADSLVLMTPAQPAPPHLGDDLRRRLVIEQQNYPTPLSRPKTRPTLRKRRRNLELVGLAMAAIAAIVIGIGAFIATRDGEMSIIERYEALQERDDTVQVDFIGEVEGLWGHVLASPDGMTAMIAMWALPEIQDEQAFELWLVDETAMENGAALYSVMLFSDEDDEGPTVVWIPLDKSIHQYTGLGVSIEKDDGHHEAPSGDPIIRANL